MARIIGVGAVMIYSNDPAAMSRWYAETMGIDTVGYGEGGCYYGVIKGSTAGTETQFAFLRAKEELGARGRAVMVNYEVDDIDSFQTRLKARGIVVKTQAESEYGRFLHIEDPEGNPIEIWQAPPPPPR